MPELRATVTAAVLGGTRGEGIDGWFSSFSQPSSTMKKPVGRNISDKTSSELLDIDTTSKGLIILTSLYCISTTTTNSLQEVIFVRYIWVPQVLISSILVLTRVISHLTVQFNHRDTSSLLMGDVFILTTIDKLIAIGYNAHLIIFFITRRDIDIAYMVLPVIICLYYLLESAYTVAYLDTVYFGVSEWQEKLYRWWPIGNFQTTLIPQHLLISFFFYNYSSLTIHFRQPVYDLRK